MSNHRLSYHFTSYYGSDDNKLQEEAATTGNTDRLHQIIIYGAVHILYASSNAQAPGQKATDEARWAPNGKDPTGPAAPKGNQPPRTSSPKRQRLSPKEDMDEEYVEEEIKQEN